MSENGMTIESVSLKVLRVCAIECALQMSGEQSVAWMVNAWKAAESMMLPLIHDDILALGALVEPLKNADGYRQVGVRVGSSIKPPWQQVPDRMGVWLIQLGDMTPAEAFRTYEEIHPFRDGNGRTGLILFNLLSGTLDNPDWAPDFWVDYRRRPGYGAPSVEVPK